MKTIFMPKISKRFLFPLVAATALNTTTIANTKQDENLKKYELINNDEFKRVDADRDIVLKNDEFVHVRDTSLSATSIDEYTDKQISKKEKQFWGIVFWLISVASFFMVKHIQNQDDRENKKDSLF